MSFSTGSVSMRAFFLERTVEDDDIAGFKDGAVLAEPDIKEEATGWAGTRYSMDRQITDDTAFCAGYLNLNLTSAERKIPSGLMKSECQMAEIAELQAEGKHFLNAKERNAIKKEVKERLLPDMPLNMKSIGVVVNGSRLYAEAVSDKKSDLVAEHFITATGMKLQNLTPTALFHHLGGDVNALQPTAFYSDDPSEDLGGDFLTWLWYKADTGSEFKVGDREAQVFIEGPMTFVNEGEGAHEVILRKGVPSISNEAKSALTSGKKLHVAKVHIILSEEEVWACKFDASTFTFSGLKVPKAEKKLGKVEKFEANVKNVEKFLSLLEAIYQEFTDLRKDDQKWKDEITSLVNWMDNKAVK